jgi:ABC-2 type transport system ATP-binding protein
MQQRFVELILEEKGEGKTIFMSSHIFAELEKTCDRAAMIKDGRMILEETIEAIRASRKQKLFVTIDDDEEGGLQRLAQAPFTVSVKGNVAELDADGNWNEIFRLLATMNVVKLHSVEEDLEHLFLNYYGREELK